MKIAALRKGRAGMTFIWAAAHFRAIETEIL